MPTISIATNARRAFPIRPRRRVVAKEEAKTLAKERAKEKAVEATSRKRQATRIRKSAYVAENLVTPRMSAMHATKNAATAARWGTSQRFATGQKHLKIRARHGRTKPGVGRMDFLRRTLMK